MATVKKGTTFHWHYADGNPLWVVKKSRGNKTWDCEIDGDDVDFAGTHQVFTTAQIEASLRQSALFTGLMNAHDRWYASQKPGTIVHYSNGFNQFVRCEVVVGRSKEGKVCNQLKSIALVGEWRSYDLPRRSNTGEIIEGYHAKHISTGETFEPNFSNIYEASADLQKKVDPRTLPPINLSVPEMTPEEAHKAFLWKTIYNVRELLGGEGLQGDLHAEYAANPLKTLTDAFSVLQNALSKIKPENKVKFDPEFVEKITKILKDCVYNIPSIAVTLQGPDDEGRWVLANSKGETIPLVNCYEDHYNAALLFGFDNCNDKNPNDQEAALEWLLEYNGEQLHKDVPSFLTYYIDGSYRNVPITAESWT